MAYLFAAFLVLWALTFGYVFSIAARQKRLLREVELLRLNRDSRATSATSATKESQI